MSHHYYLSNSNHRSTITICPIRIVAKQINILEILYGIRTVVN